MYIQRISNEAKEVLTMAREKHWGVRIIGEGDMLTSHVHEDDWLYIPLEQDHSIIPKRALDRLRAIKAAGIRTQGAIVAHEAPRLLAPPKQDSKIAGIDKKKIKRALLTGTVLAVAGGGVMVAFVTIVVSIVAVLFAAMAAVGVLMGFAFMLVSVGCLIDPCLIVCLDDEYGTRIELMRWISEVE